MHCDVLLCEETEGTGMHNQHVLIVEDDAIIAARLHDILIALGYEVSEPVASGEEAVAQAATVRPDLILMDVNLYGEMNGVEAAARIHAVMDVPLIYITAYSDNDLLQRAKVTDPYGYLVKPVQERELQATIEMALHKHAMMKVVVESEERYRAVVANAKDAVYLFDAETLRIVETNDAFRCMLGYTDEDLLHLHLQEFVRLPLDRIHDSVQDSLRDRHMGSGERRYFSKSGQPVDVSASASMITCGGRRTICVVAHDITERKRAEAQLQESESRLKIILKSIRAGVMIIDAETHQILEINDEAARILRRSPDHIAGLTCHNVVCPADRGACPITDLKEAGDVCDRVILNAEGEKVPIIKMVKTMMIDGRVRLLETFIDVSERKKAEEALTEERNLLQTVVNSLPHQIYAKDESKRFILSNACNTVSLGFRREEELFGRTDAELFSTELSTRSSGEEDMILTGAVPSIDSLDEAFDPATGKLLRSLQVAKRPLRNAAGRITGVVGINIDRTKEKMAELELRESEERFRSIIENIGDGLVIMDLYGKIEYVNRAAAELYQYRKEDMIGKTISNFVAPELSATLLEKHFQRLQEGKALVFEIDIRRGDNESRSLLTAVVARSAADGRLTGAYETFTDITERKNAETALAERNRQLMLSKAGAEEQARLLKVQAHELEKARQQAEEASRMKSEFVANMSHEIRTPLNGIIGMTSLLSHSNLNVQQCRFLSVINSSSNSLLAIINDILDFSKIEAGKMELKENDFNLRAELEYATDIFWYKAKEKGVELTCIVDTDVPDALHGDSMRLRQVLTNLISNAVKFTQEGMVVLHVRFVEENAFGTVLNFTVSDTGIGIPPEAMNKLFKPFSQVNGTLTREHGGTGLGLAISKRLVELLGGSITVVSRVDKGSIFRFSATFAPSRGNTAAVWSSPAVSAKKILLAHGNAVVRKILQMMANAFHLSFAIARTGASVEKMLKAAIAEGVPYDMLFLGEQLQDITGSELLHTLESNPQLREIKTVLVGPFPGGVANAVTEAGGMCSVLARFSKQSEFYDALCSATGIGADAPLPPGLEDTGGGPAGSGSEPDTPLRILVVDDNIVNQQVAADLLEAMGHAPDIAANGQTACEMAAAQSYDIIFMDCQMPVMDGYEATRRMHARTDGPYHGVIIAMTAHAIEGDREACVAAGMDDYIAKPIRFEELRLMIDKWKKKIFQTQE
jgi:two-component system, sensor histidine kinase and response regulator